MKTEDLKQSKLKLIAFAELPNWSVQHLAQHQHSYNTSIQLFRIGSFLKRSKIPIEITDGEVYSRITIKTNNNGVFLRDIVEGSKIGTKKQFLVKKGQFVLSKIDARNGAFGVVPKELDRAIITGNFWAFDVEKDIVDPHFLSLITTTASFMKFSENASNGTTNRHYLQESLFLDQKVPLPSLKDQRRIVKEYNSALNQSQNNIGKANNLKINIDSIFEKELDLISSSKSFIPSSRLQFIKSKNLDRWGVESISRFKKMEFIFNGKHKVVPFKEVILDFQYGISDKASSEKIGLPVLRMNNINNGELNLTNLKYINENAVSENFILEHDDILFNRTNSKELVGKTAIFNVRGNYTFASYLIRIKVDKLKADPNYINYLLNTQILQIQKDLVSRQITGQANINAQEMREFLIPLPPLDKQIEIAETVRDIKKKIKQLTKVADLKRQQAAIEFEKEIFSKI